MSEAAWLALAAGMLSFSGMAIVVMIKAPWKKNNVKGFCAKPADIPVNCPEHSGLVMEQKSQGRNITVIQTDVKKLLVTTGEIKGLLEKKR